MIAMDAGAATPERAPHFVFARTPDLERAWPFMPERLVQRLGDLGTVEVVQVAGEQPLGERADLAAADAIALFGGRLTARCVAAAPRLAAVGCITDKTGRGLPLEALAARSIAVIDATPAWGQSVAEVALCLALAALRRVPQWHAELATTRRVIRHETAQFCDAAGFANGDLGTKQIGVIGLGQIGGRVARWCAALAAEAPRPWGPGLPPAPAGGLAGQVLGYDPFLAPAATAGWGVRLVDVDTLVDESEVVFVTVPPTPTAHHLLDRGRIGRLRRGALVVLVTRAQPVDMDALRERVLASELCVAFDVYDVEPIPADDPLRGRPNVVHTPHIAGRTRDANLRVAELIAGDFARILRGEPARYELTPAAIDVRLGRSPPG
jgi:D-3-phosphoglycerate dehydrogenase